ncbi:MAG: heme-dependent oxidative N-demethylase subunit alpha family protein [Bacteroidota bacterium]
MTGVYTTAPGLARSEGKIFDVDENYEAYIANKKRCRDEDISKYYCRHDFRKETEKAVIERIDNTQTDFDSLCSSLQEDVAVVQLDGEKDWLAAIHLCSPNHWDPRTKIGRPFDEIHTPVPEIGRTVKNYQVMLKMIIDKEPFTRFAWGLQPTTG